MSLLDTNLRVCFCVCDIEREEWGQCKREGERKRDQKETERWRGGEGSEGTNCSNLYIFV